ncbi:MAG: helix-turn-helix domain-containing protein [Pseudomonadota bacterium]
MNGSALKRRCAGCWARELTICGDLSEAELAGLTHMTHGRHLHAGTPLFHEGDPVTAVFTVTQGMLKLYKLFDGRRQVIGFACPGQFLGLASGDAHCFGAEAINDVEICSFPKEQFQASLERFPKLAGVLLDRARDELAGAYDQMLLLGRKTARERVASLLLSLSDRDGRGPTNVISLPMTRNDIADYLGLTVETVSRVFTTLRKQKMVRMSQANLVEIIDHEALSELAKRH